MLVVMGELDYDNLGSEGGKTLDSYRTLGPYARKIESEKGIENNTDTRHKRCAVYVFVLINNTIQL